MKANGGQCERLQMILICFSGFVFWQHSLHRVQRGQDFRLRHEGGSGAGGHDGIQASCFHQPDALASPWDILRRSLLHSERRLQFRNHHVRTILWRSDTLRPVKTSRSKTKILNSNSELHGFNDDYGFRDQKWEITWRHRNWTVRLFCTIWCDIASRRSPLSARPSLTSEKCWKRLCAILKS